MLHCCAVLQFYASYYTAYAQRLATWGYAVVQYNTPFLDIITDADEVNDMEGYGQGLDRVRIKLGVSFKLDWGHVPQCLVVLDCSPEATAEEVHRSLQRPRRTCPLFESELHTRHYHVQLFMLGHTTTYHDANARPGTGRS